MKRCVDKAEKQGIHLGVHTLSNFITTNDPYVTPVPDPRLAKVGSTTISKELSSDDTIIFITHPDFFNEMKNNTLHAAVIGDEIIRYKTVSKEKPWELLDCRRGAFGTHVNSHAKGSKISKLMDHSYKVFLFDNNLSEEIAIRIADLFNQTGLRQISFDGLEGNWSTGMGQYGRQRFVKIWYDHLKPELRGKIITDASNPGHFFRHIYTRMNWGEPWYAGFRESQTRYRLMNLEYFHRNLMPAMLGWFQMRSTTSLEDIEWLLARAAGFDAGFALVTSLEVINSNGLGDKILSTIKAWESLRMNGAFSEDQKKQMRNINLEFHLEKTGENAWILYPVHTSLKNVHERKTLQPGEPTYSTFSFTNPYKEQNLSFTLKLTGEDKRMKVSDMYLTLDHAQTVQIPATIRTGQILKYSGKGRAVLFDQNWNELRRINISPLKIKKGEHSLEFGGKFSGKGKAAVHLEFRCKGKREPVTKK